MVHRLAYALDCLTMGVILSTAFSWAMIHHDIFGFATADMADVATLWAMFVVFLAPCAALTDWLFRDPPPADGPR